MLKNPEEAPLECKLRCFLNRNQNSTSKKQYQPRNLGKGIFPNKFSSVVTIQMNNFERNLKKAFHSVAKRKISIKIVLF